ncbi:MAG: hypothetical protein AB1422_14245 [bacterium]
MRKKLIIAITLLLTFLSSNYVYAELTKGDIEEIRRIVKEEVNQAVNGLRNEMKGEINGLRNEMNAKFEAVDKRFEDMSRLFNWMFILLAAIIALNGAMVGSVVWLAVQDRPISKKHYDQIMVKEEEFETKLKGFEKLLKSHLQLAHTS